MTSQTGDTVTVSENPTASFEQAELARLGITVVTIDTFHYKTFRYSNARDAIAQAERDAGVEHMKTVEATAKSGTSPSS